MKQRFPTPEEMRLWQEDNRHTRRAHNTLSPPLGVSEEQPHPIAPPVVPTAGKIRKQLPPMTALSLREAHRRMRQYPIEATLDLHGATKLEAREKVQRFIHHQAQAHRRHVVIITGKGKGGEVGVLRAHLPDWLNEPVVRPLISAYATARPEKGGTGVTHVLLKRL